MDTAVVGSRPTESVLSNSGGRRRPCQAEAEARTPIEWAGDDPDRLAGTPERVVRAVGIFKRGVSMVTSRMLGSFQTDRATRRGFLAMIGSPRSAPHGS